MREGRGHVEYGAPGRGQKTPGKRQRDQDRARASERQRKGPNPKTPRSPQSCPHSPVDLILLPPQAITVQDRGLGLGRPVGAIGPGGSWCRGHCLREASQGCGAVHDAWVVGQLIVLGGGKRGRAPGRHQETSLPWHPGDAPPCPPDPALSFPVSEPCHLRPRTSHGAIWVGLRAPVPWSSPIPRACEKCSTREGGSREERLTQVSGLRVRVGVRDQLMVIPSSSQSEGGGEPWRDSQRLGARYKRETEGRRQRDGGEKIQERERARGREMLTHGHFP